MQPDIVVKNDDITLGIIHRDILLKYSKLIKKSLKRLDDFGGQLIDTIDIREICDDKGLLHPSCNIKWMDAVSIINLQYIFMKYYKFDIVDDVVLIFEFIKILAWYLLMNSLTNFCKSLLEKKYYIRLSNEEYDSDDSCIYTYLCIEVNAIDAAKLRKKIIDDYEQLEKIVDRIEQLPSYGCQIQDHKLSIDGCNFGTLELTIIEEPYLDSVYDSTLEDILNEYTIYVEDLKKYYTNAINKKN